MDEREDKSILVEPKIELEYVYDGDLDYDSLKLNPILKPISEINKTYCNLHIMAIKAVLECEEELNMIRELEEINPRYSNTKLMATIKKIINLTKTIIHSQDLQRIGIKEAINEMVKINGEKYKLIDNEQERIKKIKEDLRKELEKDYNKKEIPKENLESVTGDNNIVIDKKEVIPPNISDSPNPINTNEMEEDVFEKLKEIVGEEEPEEKEVVPNKKYSTLLEREV